jgi:hypothetical protein
LEEKRNSLPLDGGGKGWGWFREIFNTFGEPGGFCGQRRASFDFHKEEGK